VALAAEERVTVVVTHRIELNDVVKSPILTTTMMMMKD
jgi:hypothetical protein